MKKSDPWEETKDLAPLEDEPSQEEFEKRTAHLAMTFLKEVSILLVGVFVGFFWRMYFEEAGNETHIIIVLLLMILCLTRYIYLFARK